MNTFTKVVVLAGFVATLVNCVDICNDDCVQGMLKVLFIF